MPQRFLRPGITNSPLWNAVDHVTGNLFIRLLTLVDDYGRTDGRTSVIFGQCFSVWNELQPKKCIKPQQVAAMLDELARVGLIDLYEVDGKRVLQIHQWQERIRDGAKEKWPSRTESAAPCCASLPPSSPPTPSPASPPTIKRHSSNGSQANAVEPATDEAWIAELSRSRAYQGIDVLREYSKMEVWCKTAKKQPSRRRFINWLNKCERPLAFAAKRQSIDPSKIELPSEFREWVSGKYPARTDEIGKWKTWADVPDYFREEWKREKILPLTRAITG